MNNEFEIYAKDFLPNTQTKLLEFLGLESPEDGNYDIFPIIAIPKPEEL